MKLVFRILALFILVLPQLVKAQSSIELFNKNNLDNWYAYNAETGKHENAAELFKVEQKMIRLYGPNAGYLMSKQSFQNFRLSAEYRWNTDSTFTRKSDKKNSGLMYLVPIDTPDVLWPKGIQFQIKEGATGDFVLLQEVTLQMNGQETEPGKSVAVPRMEDATNPIGKWNSLIISFSNGKVKQELNGKLVNEGDAPSVSEGRILLQYEGYPIDFRNIVVEEL
ncbi:MAG: DUF1080 domain-containing protein [Prolixibacteraceae bacterium]